MADPKQLIDKAVLKTLVPPSALNHENFHELAGKTYMEEVAAGRTIFRRGDTDKKTTYVLEGEVQITSDKGVSSTVVGGTANARHPLAHNQPRQHTAVARSACKIARIDSDLLDILLTWDQLSGIEVSEIHPETSPNEDAEADWMTRILQSQAFRQIPAQVPLLRRGLDTRFQGMDRVSAPASGPQGVRILRLAGGSEQQDERSGERGQDHAPMLPEGLLCPPAGD